MEDSLILRFHVYVVFSVETFGRLGDGSLQLLHAAWQRIQERRSEARGWQGVWMFQRWLSLLVCDPVRSLIEAQPAVAWGLRPAPLEVPLAVIGLPYQLSLDGRAGVYGGRWAVNAPI